MWQRNSTDVIKDFEREIFFELSRDSQSNYGVLQRVEEEGIRRE
jgi:hypothetical protein